MVYFQHLLFYVPDVEIWISYNVPEFVSELTTLQDHQLLAMTHHSIDHKQLLINCPPSERLFVGKRFHSAHLVFGKCLQSSKSLLQTGQNLRTLCQIDARFVDCFTISLPRRDGANWAIRPKILSKMIFFWKATFPPRVSGGSSVKPVLAAVCEDQLPSKKGGKVIT